MSELDRGALDIRHIRNIVDAALLAADTPLTVERLVKLFAAGELPPEEPRAAIREALASLEADLEMRGYELKRVASGYRYQVRQDLSLWVSRLWEERPPRYSRALMETLALVAYKQPVTRGDIEQVRGVSVSQNIMRTLLERGWIRVVGVREVPGRPSMYGTTRAFLDYFNLKSLSELPPLDEIKALIEPLVVEEEELPSADDSATADERHGDLLIEDAAQSGDGDGGVQDVVGTNPALHKDSGESSIEVSVTVDEQGSQIDSVETEAQDPGVVEPDDRPSAQVVPLLPSSQR